MTTTSIKLQERETSLLLRTAHSQLEFTLWRPGFTLTRGERLLLESGPGWGAPTSNLSQWQVEDDRAVLTYNRGMHGMGRLALTALEDGWRFVWDQPTRDTFDLASGKHWYGQGELINQLWPLERISLWEAPFITWDNGPAGLGNIQTPAWVTATGVAVVVEPPSNGLIVGFNAPAAHLTSPRWDLSDQMAPPATRPLPAMDGASGLLTLHDQEAPLHYRLLVGVDAPSAYRRLVQQVGKPNRIPPEGLLRSPIWTTWARHKMDIDQETVLRFAREIREHGFPGGTMEIDDKWQRAYGDITPDPVRFPDPASMVRELNEMGFAVTLWVTPFLNPDSANAQEAARRGLIVRQAGGDPYQVMWWQGYGYLLDVSNPEAVQWWVEQLRALQHQIGLAGYKFDGGEANYLPADAHTHTPITRNEYSARWVEIVATHFPYGEARCGWYSQRQPILFRQWDKFSTWGQDNGLASIITTALALSMSGYPFTMPDMIGGNAYFGVQPDRELVIRWTQASAPMLAIQFSVAPWDYDAETVAICRKYAQLHVDLADQRINAAREAVETGEPVIRPVFWPVPRDVEAHAIDDEYLVGDDLLVAPVVVEGARMRDIYLPAGQWRDYWSDTLYTGGQWLRDYPAPLDTLPLFARVG